MKSYHLNSFLLFAAFLLASCISTNLTPLQKGKTQLEEDEQRIWNRSQEEETLLDKSDIIYRDSTLTAYVNSIAQKLNTNLSQSGQLMFRVQVIKDPLLNAFTYPNGVIYIHTGILAKMENEAQLATLLG